MSISVSATTGEVVPEIDPLHERVSAIESEVARLSEENAANRVMAAMADRDVAEFRAVQKAHTKVLNALRETQVDHGSILRDHGSILREQGQTLNEHSQILNEHTRTLNDHTQALDALKAGQSELRGELRQQSTTQRSEMAGLRADVANLSEGQAAILRHLKIEI